MGNNIIDVSLLNRYVIEHWDSLSIGLLNGKAGLAIYYATYAKESKENRRIYNRLVKSLYESINTGLPIEIGNGILDIAICIDYILSHFQGGNSDYILSDIDSYIFRQFGGYRKVRQSLNSSIDTLFYISYHLFYGIKNATKREIFERESMLYVEHIYSHIIKDGSLLLDPVSFSLTNRLVLFLESLVSLYRQGIYSQRIFHICNELSFLVIGRVPISHSNRLQMLYIIKKICNTIPDLNKAWYEFTKILEDNTSFMEIINKELRSNQILFSDGLSGIFLFAMLCNRECAKEVFELDLSLFRRKVTEANFERDNRSLLPFLTIGLNGYWGIRMLYDYLSNNPEKSGHV